MAELLRSTLVGNVIGIISLLIGVVSFTVSCLTYNKTRIIEAKIREEKIHAIEKYQFSVETKEIEDGLEKLLRGLENKNQLGYKQAKQIFSMIYHVSNKETVLIDKDKKRLKEISSDMKRICDRIDRGEKIIQSECIACIEETLSIIKRGEYQI